MSTNACASGLFDPESPNDDGFVTGVNQPSASKCTMDSKEPLVGPVPRLERAVSAIRVLSAKGMWLCFPAKVDKRYTVEAMSVAEAASSNELLSLA